MNASSDSALRNLGFVKLLGGIMSVWFLVFQSLTFIGILAILILIWTHQSQNDNDSLTKRIDEATSRTDTSIIQISGKQEAFALNTSQALSTLRSELLSQSSELRQEVVKAIANLGDQTRQTLEELRKSITERQDQLTGELSKGQTALLDTINTHLNGFQTTIADKFNGFQRTQLEQGDSLRTTLEQRLDKLNESNSKKLDEMRETVDEKLHKTLETRLTQSFGLVTEQLGKVQTGLGEMKELAVNVGDLKRVLNNVSTRGTLGNTMLGAQLEQVLAPNQFAKEVCIRPNTNERVDYVIRLPFSDEKPVLLPIDSKFPKEDWERLEEAARLGDTVGVEAARKGLERQIKEEAKKIAEKYIFPPTTTNFAFMYLPIEGLFSEALRIPGLVDELQLKYRVSLAGPTNFMAILNSLQMGFRTLAIQKKSSEVWRLLAATKVEFQNFGTLMSKVEKQVGTVQSTIQEVNSKTRTINRKLKNVEVLEMSPSVAAPQVDLDAQGGLLLEVAAESTTDEKDESGSDEVDLV